MNKYYYYNVKPNFILNDKITFEAELEQPKVNSNTEVYDYAITTDEVYFRFNVDVPLPYSMGSYIGVRENCFPFNILSWYIVIDIKIINRNGLWIEKAIMKRKI
jgi:hypothetical protein